MGGNHAERTPITPEQREAALYAFEKYPSVLARDYEGNFQFLEEQYRARGLPEKWEDLTEEQKIRHHIEYKRYQREMHDFGREIFEKYGVKK